MSADRSERCKSELEVLEAIYGSELIIVCNSELKVRRSLQLLFKLCACVAPRRHFTDKLLSLLQIAITFTSEPFEPLCLTISLPKNYPEVVPNYSFSPLKSGRWLTGEREKKLLASMKALFDAEDSDNLMRVIEWIRENAHAEMALTEADLKGPNQAKQNDAKEKRAGLEKRPSIYHSHKLTDRKSKFQAHFARCFTQEEAQLVLESIRTDPKCSGATHPCIFALRLDSGSTEVLDSSDDGEGGAAVYLENLLHTRKIRNGVLMVTRWYGGTNLGPDRFHHIASIAESLLNSVFDRTLPPSDSSSSFLSTASLTLSINQALQKHPEAEVLIQTFPSSATPTKWSTMLSQRQYHLLPTIQSATLSNGNQIWSYESPLDVNIANPAR